MTIVAGVDGCRAGWLCITRDMDTGRIESAVFENAQSLIRQKPEPSIIAVDIPIGLTEAGPRQCDLIARKLLGRRASSVFPAPVRGILRAKTRLEADRTLRRIEGKGVPAQAFAIFGKVLEFDEILSPEPRLQDRIKEIHPEVCFRAWNNERAMSFSKRLWSGKAERHMLVITQFAAEAVEETLNKYRVKDAAHDDIYDAFAALWTAGRILENRAAVIPDPSPVDVKGLHMEMWY